MESIAVFWAGFVAVVVAAAVFRVFRSFGLTLFSPGVQLGCLVLRNPRRPATDTLGFGLLVAPGSTVVPFTYQALFHIGRGPSGLALRAAHGRFEAASLPVPGTITACIRAGLWPAPGRFGIRWGRLAPPAVAAGHATYGALYGALPANF